MFKKKIKDETIDVKNVNDVILLVKRILKISYVLIIIAAILVITIISKEWNIKDFIFSFLKVVSPLFIGFIIAWLFNPIVTWLQKKGLRRSVGTGITYIGIIVIVYIFLNALVPLLIEQTNDFVNSIPNVVNAVTDWLDNVLNSLKNIEYIDEVTLRDNIASSVKNFGNSMTEQLPTITLNVLKQLFSGIGSIIIGFIIGFYLLLTFDSVGPTLVGFLPKNIQKNTRELFDLVNSSMIRYVQGALIDSTVVFVVTSVVFWIVGLKAPLLFGLFCGITNVIPFAGPYIGGFPAVLVGFSQSTTIGILILIVIVVIQLIEGNFFQPYIMSKTTKLHPVTIILGLLVFGHFWGILGMVVSTPIIGSLKAIFLFFDKKYEFFGFVEPQAVDEIKMPKEEQ